MATGQQYTKTGVQERVGGAGRTWAEWFSMWSNRASLIPVVGAYLAWPMGMIGTTLETLGQLFKGNIGSAITVAAAGTVATTVNAAVSTTPNWWIYGGNVASGLTTGSVLGTHARKLTESVIGGVTGILGMKPEVLSSHTAGIGSLDNAYAQSVRGPGYWATRRAEEMGRDPRQMYDQYRTGAGAEHTAQLDAARANGPAMAGRA